MARTESYMLPLGTKAPNFSLPNTLDGTTLSLDQVKGAKGTLVVFMCNHCPYVLHLLDQLISLSGEIKEWEINTVAISSNDIGFYPDDRPELMKKLADEKSFGFPYLYDESQQAAMDYEAACTPDFYLFDDALKLVYRGKFDDSRPQNDLPITGADLHAACKNLIDDLPQEKNQKPSLGCGIKWKAGNEPKGFFN